MTNKKALLDRLGKLEKAKRFVFRLVYADGHTEKTTRISTVVDAVCATPQNGLVAVDWPGRDKNNVFSAMIASMEEGIDDLSLSLYQMIDEALEIGRFELPDLERERMRDCATDNDDDKRRTCIDGSERPDGGGSSPLATSGEVREEECDTMELCVDKSRNLI